MKKIVFEEGFEGSNIAECSGSRSKSGNQVQLKLLSLLIIQVLTELHLLIHHNFHLL